MRPLTQDDVDAAHSLSVAVGWPHRAADWRAVLAVGEGLCAPDAVGRLAGTAMWWPIGKKVAAIGMVIVAPQAQGQGLGRRLMHAVFAAAQRQTLTLNATSAGVSLYISEGFRRIGTIWQYQGLARPVVVPGAAAFPVRSATQTDGAAIAALDRAALGYDRASILQALTRDAEGLVHERDGRLVGFAYCGLRAGTGDRSVIAADERIALALVRPSSRDMGGLPPCRRSRRHAGIGAPARSWGLISGRGRHHMIKGRKPRVSGRARVFGLINQASAEDAAVAWPDWRSLQIRPSAWQVWARIFAEEAPEMELRLWPDIGDTSEVRYLVAWLPPDDLPRAFRTSRSCFRRVPASTSSISQGCRRHRGGAHGRSRPYR